MGIMEEQMKREVEWRGVTYNVINHLETVLGSEFIERKSQMKDLGNWLIVTDAARYQEVRGLTDEVLEEMGELIRSKIHWSSSDAEMPRRTDMSIASHQYERYLDKLDKVLPEQERGELPVI